MVEASLARCFVEGVQHANRSANITSVVLHIINHGSRLMVATSGQVIGVTIEDRLDRTKTVAVGCRFAVENRRLRRLRPTSTDPNGHLRTQCRCSSPERIMEEKEGRSLG